jgi:hypothetical protein
MTATISPPAASGSPASTNSSFRTPSNNTGASFGAGFVTNDPRFKENTQKVKILMPMTSSGMFNPFPIVHGFLTHLKKADLTASLISEDPSITPIQETHDIPKDNKLSNYASAPQTDSVRKQYAFFLIFKSTKSLGEIKFDNPPMMHWLQKNKLWLKNHSHTSNYTTTLGFIHGLHPTYGHRETFKEALEPYMEDVEIQLMVETDFYYKSNNRVETQVVKIQVDSKDTEAARSKLSDAFNDPDFLEKMSKGDPDSKLDFIPFIQKGIIDRDTYRAALESHRNLNMKIRSIAISGINNTDEETTAEYLGKQCTFWEMLSTVKDPNDVPFFKSWEPTKFSDEAGRFLLLTTDDKIEAAEKTLDDFLAHFDQSGYNETLAIPGEKVRRTFAKVPSKFSQTFSGLSDRYKMSDDLTPAVSPRRRNVWKTKRTPQFFYDSDTEFPPLNTNNATSKKARHTNNNTDEASVNTVNTTNTDERTEFDSRMSTLTTDFQKKLNEIANTAEQRARVTAQKLQQAEIQRAADNEKLLTIFEQTQKRVDDAFDAISDLKATMLRKESRDKVLHQMVQRMYESLARESKVPPLDERLTEIINRDDPNNLSMMSDVPKEDDDSILDMDTEASRDHNKKRSAGELSNVGAAAKK